MALADAESKAEVIGLSVLKAGRQWYARLLYFVLYIALGTSEILFDIHNLLLHRALVGLVLIVSYWVLAGFWLDLRRIILANVESLPGLLRRPYLWLGGVAFTGLALLVPALALGPSERLKLFHWDTPLHMVIAGMAIAGLACVGVFMVAAGLVVIFGVFALVVWLPFILIRSTLRKRAVRQSYEEYARARATE